MAPTLSRKRAGGDALVFPVKKKKKELLFADREQVNFL